MNKPSLSKTESPDYLAAVATALPQSEQSQFIQSLVKKGGDDELKEMLNAIHNQFQIDDEKTAIEHNAKIPSATEDITHFVTLFRKGFSNISNYINELNRVNNPEIIETQANMINRLRGQLVQILSSKKNLNDAQTAIEIHKETVFALTNSFPKE